MKNYYINNLGDECWTLLDSLHRDDGPALINKKNGIRKWYILGKQHRIDGPAVEHPNGNNWWLNGMRHREGGPAIEYKDGTKYWYTKGLLHRDDGPAIEYSDGRKAWYLNDTRYNTLVEFITATKNKELTIGEIESLLGYSIKIIKDN